MNLGEIIKIARDGLAAAKDAKPERVSALSGFLDALEIAWLVDGTERREQMTTIRAAAAHLHVNSQPELAKKLLAVGRDLTGLK